MRVIPQNPRSAKFVRSRLATTVSAVLLSTVAYGENSGFWDCRINGNNGEWACAETESLHLTLADQDRRDREQPKRLNLPPTVAVYPPRESTQERELDWVGQEEILPGDQTPQCRRCGGMYLDPLGSENSDLPPEEADMVAHAGSSELTESVLTLDDRVEVQHGSRRLSTQRMILDRQQGLATLEGSVRVREPGVMLEAERAELRPDNGEARLDKASFVLHQNHLRGQSENLYRNPEGDINLDDAKLTYCAPGSNDWTLQATSLDILTERELAVARGAKLKIRDVPVFYMPYMRLPLSDQRLSGFLWPDVGSESKGGIDIALPYYFNLAPNYDALYTPQFIQDRGTAHEIAGRYLGRALGSWEFGGVYLPGDRKFESEFPQENNHDRWLFQTQQTGRIGQRWVSKIDFSRASDVDYLRDLDTTSLNNRRQTSLKQQGSLAYQGEDWFLDLNFQQFQQLAEDIRENYRKLPQFTGRYRSGLQPFELSPILLAQYSNFDIEDPDRPTGQRLYGEVGASYPMRWQAGFFNSTAKYRYVNYDLRDNPIAQQENSPSTGSALVSLDGGLFFERELAFAGRQLVQTLEPRVFYLFSDYRDQRDQPNFDSAELTFTYNQLFRETRFSGHDRLDDANQIAMGLTTRFLDGYTGLEYLSASLGQIYYLEDRRVRLLASDNPEGAKSSEIAAELSYRPTPRLNLLSNIVWDPNEDEVNSANFQMSYSTTRGALYNVGYTFRRPLEFQASKPVTEQTHLSFYKPLGDSNWRFYASWSYSLEAHTSVEDMIGFEYDSCCWKFRLLHLRYFDVDRQNVIIDPDDPNLERQHTTQAQIMLKGLGGFGRRVNRVLEDMIRGFRDREI